MHRVIYMYNEWLVFTCRLISMLFAGASVTNFQVVLFVHITRPYRVIIHFLILILLHYGVVARSLEFYPILSYCDRSALLDCIK